MPDAAQSHRPVPDGPPTVAPESDAPPPAAPASSPQSPGPADHRRLGRELDLFATDPLVGAGLPLWLPDGAVIRTELEAFAAERAIAAGCRRIYTPVLAKRELFERSGHWGKFAGDMFPAMLVGDEEFVLRPANCPHAAAVYAHGQHSYRDLPVRLNELGSMFRSELSGVLGGLSRVRQIDLDDTHVFCREDQIADEVAAAVGQIHDAYRILGLDVEYYRLSLSGPDGRYLGDPQLWERAEAALEAVLDDLGLPYRKAADEAAFYGPKIDVQVRDAAGREETLSTMQLDFNQPERFDLGYIDAAGGRQRPVMIHRGLLGSIQRLAALLIERYHGSFPVWLAAQQVRVLPIGDEQEDAARRICERFREAGLRAEFDASDRSLGKRVRSGREDRVPYLAVVGGREMADGTVALRLRDGRQLPGVAVGDAVAGIAAVARSRSRLLDLR